MPVIVLGAGTFAVEVCDLLEDCGDKAVAFVINRGEWEPGQRLLGLPVYDTRHMENWPDGFEFPFVAGIISPERVGLIGEMIKLGHKSRQLFHPSVRCSKTVMYGRGVVLNRHVTISRDTLLESQVIINRSASIGHNVHVASYTSIGPSSCICGNVWVEEGCYIGANSTILENLRVGEGAVVGAGAVVTKDVPAHTTVKGIPAR